MDHHNWNSLFFYRKRYSLTHFNQITLSQEQVSTKTFIEDFWRNLNTELNYLKPIELVQTRYRKYSITYHERYYLTDSQIDNNNDKK